MTQDLAKSPLISGLSTFEKRLAGAVLLQALADYNTLEEPQVGANKDARYHAKKRRALIIDAEAFFSSRKTSRGLQFWLDVLLDGEKDTIRRAWFKHLQARKRALYDAEAARRSGGALAGFPAWVSVEAYRRVTESGWARYFVKHAPDETFCDPARLKSADRDYWRGLYRASVGADAAVKEANDVMFEFKHGLIEEAA